MERASNKQFLVDGRIGPQIYLAGVEPNDVTYPVLLSILRANGFAAFESEGHVNIVPDAEHSLPSDPVVQADDASIPADEFVTRVLTVTNIEAPALIPILRPLLPQAAHLAAMGTTNRLIIMDRYANVQRITEIIRSLDVAAAELIGQKPPDLAGRVSSPDANRAHRGRPAPVRRRGPSPLPARRTDGRGVENVLLCPPAASSAPRLRPRSSARCRCAASSTSRCCRGSRAS